MLTSIFQTGSSFFSLCLKAFPIRRKYSSTEYMEKPRAFDPRGQATVTPRGKIGLTLCGKIKMTP